MRKTILVLTLTLLLAASPAPAWNEAGHRIVAAIAYDRLTPQVRAKVDDLIRRHPDYESIFLARIPRDTNNTPGARARAAFIAASYWPDLIRGDDRFYADTNPNASPTRLLPGFPDMGRHTNWHYWDIPFSTDGTVLRSQPPPNALSEIERLLQVVGNPPDSSPEPAYALPWLLHLIGDVHNPLHATSRFLSHQTGGDQGGNLVVVANGSPNGETLHSLWDSAGGTNTGGRAVNRAASEYLANYLRNFPKFDPQTSPRDWMLESFSLARTSAYSFGNETGSEQDPLVLPRGYREMAQTLAQQRLAQAGIRLADALNAALQ